MSNREEILTKIINGETVTDTPTSRSEQYLTAIANGSGAENLPTPISREDHLLKTIAEKGIGGGGGIMPSGSVSITANGQYDVTSYAEANVNVEYKAQDKDIHITENGSQTIQPDEGYDVISSVTVSVAVSDGQDMLQQRVDETNSCQYLFYEYTGTNLDFIQNLDTSEVTTMKNMFQGCKQLTSLDLSSFNTSNVQYMNQMFTSCLQLTSLDLSSFNTSKVRGMEYMFDSCIQLTSLDLSSFNTSNVTDMSYMFKMCQKLTSLDLSSFDTSNTASMAWMFHQCGQLPSLDLSSFNTSKVKNISYFCNGCYNLETIQGVIDLHSATNVTGIVSDCRKLTTITLKNIKKEIQIGSGTSYGHLLTIDSLVNTIKETWDYSGGETTYKLTMGSENIAKLTDVYVKLITPTAEQIEADPYIENKKPCEVCASTDEGAMLISDYLNLKKWQLA